MRQGPDIRRSFRRLGGVLAATAAVFATAAAVAGSAQAEDRSDRPTAIVSLGDSAISGEGAGNYEPGTNGPEDYCHRSPAALIHRTAIPGIDASINLACSGAASANLYIDGPSHYTEISQANQLREAAAAYDIKMLVVQVGANDDPAFADTVIDCALEWLNPVSPGCNATIGAEWPARVAAMAPKVVTAIEQLRQVMQEAGYADDDYDFVLNSYASPVTENMNRLTHGVQGCPIKIADALWGRTVAVTQLSEALRGVANQTGVRFLDLSRATEGHEAYNKSVPAAARWQNALTVKLENIVNGIDMHLVQESFHPNALGHGQFGGCLTEFYAGGAPQAACVIGPDGNLHAVDPAQVAVA